jgi:hypothetical protein
MSGPNHVLPPASTTKVDLKAQAAGFFAQRRGVVRKTAPPQVRETRGLWDDDQLDEAPAPPPAAPQGRQTFTTAQLVERLHAQRAQRKAVVESGDPDGPEDTGWDPNEVTMPRVAGGASLAAGALAHRRRQQR